MLPISRDDGCPRAVNPGPLKCKSPTRQQHTAYSIQHTVQSVHHVSIGSFLLMASVRNQTCAACNFINYCADHGVGGCRFSAHGKPSGSTSSIFFQTGAKSGFGMCFDLSTLGAGAKTRLESRVKKFTPHYVCKPSGSSSSMSSAHVTNTCE